MPDAVRRASGTLTTGDVLKRALGLYRGTPDLDIADLDAGRTLLVAAWRAQPENRWLRDELLFMLGSARWVGREREGRLRSVEQTLQPPFSVLGAGALERGAPVDRHDFVLFELTAGDTDWEFAVPRRDTKLIRHALRRIQETRLKQ